MLTAVITEGVVAGHKAASNCPLYVAGQRQESDENLQLPLDSLKDRVTIILSSYAPHSFFPLCVCVWRCVVCVRV